MNTRIEAHDLLLVRSTVPYVVVPHRDNASKYWFSESRAGVRIAQNAWGCLVGFALLILIPGSLYLLLSSTPSQRSIGLGLGVAVSVVFWIWFALLIRKLGRGWRQAVVDLPQLQVGIRGQTAKGKKWRRIGAIDEAVAIIAPASQLTRYQSRLPWGWCCFLQLGGDDLRYVFPLACTRRRESLLMYADSVLRPLGLRYTVVDSDVLVNGLSAERLGLSDDQELRRITHCVACGYHVQACRGPLCPECGKPRAFVPPDAAAAKVSSR